MLAFVTMLTIDTTADLIESLADRLGCSASDVVLYLAGYQEYLPSRDSDRTFGAAIDREIDLQSKKTVDLQPRIA
jgi:hypothetical protein